MVAVIALRWPVLFSNLQSFGGDTVKWAGPAINFAQHGFNALDYLPTTSYGFYDVETGSRTLYLRWPFLPSYLITGMVYVFGESAWALRLLPLLLNLFASVYIYLIVTKAFSSPWWGVLGATCFLLFPAGLYYSLQVCDTQFWLLGSIAGFYHLERWRENYRGGDAMAVTFWLLFACASSWFGYLVVLVAAGFLMISIVRAEAVNRWSIIYRSPLPWLGVGICIILAIHTAQVIHALGEQGFISTYGNRWDFYSGGNVVNKNVPNGGWWDLIREAVRFRKDMIIERTFGYHIPKYLSSSVAVLTGLLLLLFIVRSIAGHDSKLKKSCGTIILFFSLIYIAYVIIFPSHMSRHTHNFTTQMLTPVFVVLLVYGMQWAVSMLEKAQFIGLLKFLPVVLLTMLLAGESWSYRIQDPTLWSTRRDFIELSRLFATTIKAQSSPDDLILSNHPGWSYDNNIMKYTARRTIKLKLFDIDKIKSYANDSRFKGVVFVYLVYRKDVSKEEFEKLEKYLEEAAKSVDIIIDPDAYPKLTFYRLK